MADLLANLPPVPPSLKSIAPYLQRSEELRTQDPVIAYWCAYYAAQIGISLKARDAASRDLLLALLGALEQTKNEIGPNDAIHNESVSSAYVENFALKVFANADNEDRSGHATRSTAKKFLAGANFLEVLKTFPKSDISESNQEKIRYAKWKAADISKAFREGRKPAPGPPGWAEEQEELKRLQQEQEQLEQQQIPSAPPSDSEFPPASQPTIPAATLSSYHEAPQDEPLSSNIDFSHPPTSSLRLPNDPLHPYPGWAETSETWSTAATSGISEPLSRDLLDRPDGSLSLTSASSAWGISSSSWSDNAMESVRNEENITRARSGSGSSSDVSRAERPLKRVARVSQEVEGQYSPISSIKALAEADNEPDFSPSAIGPQSPLPPPQPYSVSATKHHDSVSTVSPSSPSHIYNAFPRQSPPVVYSRLRAPPPPPVLVQEDPGELTPAIISKVQKHCRFAVSALNYEDAEQAKKELRAALALLGG